MLTTAALVCGVTACSESATGDEKPKAVPAEGGEATFASGTELIVPVPSAGRVHVTLDPPAIVDVAAAWDLAFEGYDVFSNGGVSGSGSAAAFGPLDATEFLQDTTPEFPFFTSDRTGGAFLDWYAYSGAPAHALYSRYHVLGIRDGARLFKVQILGYYGQRDGAGVAGLYSLRYAELLSTGAGPTEELTLVDGTAGGTQGSPTTANECLDLGTGTRSMIAPDQARASSDWHLCFRRDVVSVNGERGGPRGVVAVDLEADLTRSETFEAVIPRTAETERAKFDAVTASSFEGKTFRGDRVVSVFGDAWLDRSVSPPKPAHATWIAQTADGKRKVLVGFTRFDGANATTPGSIVLRAKPIR